MKKIKNGFADYYYLTESGKVYNDHSKRYLKIDKHNYKLMTTKGKVKNMSLKNLYLLVYDKVYCIDTIDNIDGEEWRVIPNTNNLYYASNYGRIKSYTKYNAILLKPYTTSRGYEKVHIMINGIDIYTSVSRLVASCFLEPPKSIDAEIHHIDRQPKE